MVFVICDSNTLSAPLLYPQSLSHVYIAWGGWCGVWGVGVKMGFVYRLEWLNFNRNVVGVVRWYDWGADGGGIRMTLQKKTIWCLSWECYNQSLLKPPPTCLSEMVPMHTAGVLLLLLRLTVSPYTAMAFDDDVASILSSSLYSSPDGTALTNFRLFHEKPLQRCIVTWFDATTQIYHAVCDYHPTTEDLKQLALSFHSTLVITLDCWRTPQRAHQPSSGCVCITTDLYT